MTLRQSCSVALSLCFSVGATALAGQIDLTNGDRLTAAVVRSDAKAVTVKSAALGEVPVPWAAIARITSEAALFVVTPQGTVSGPVSTDGGDLVVATAQGAVRIPLSAKPVMRSTAEQAAYERSLHPGLLQNIAGGVSVGVTLARGNSHTTNWSVGSTAVRTTTVSRTSLYFTSVYAADETGTTANDMRGGLRFDRNATKRLFGVVAADYEHNELQLLDLRQVYTVGAGWHAMRGDTTTLDFLAGVNYTREAFSPAPTSNVAGATLGEDFMHQFAPGTVLTEQLIVYPDLEDLGQYRAAFDMRFATKLKKWLSWQTTLSDRYTSTPPAGTGKNDFIFTTGLNISFTH